MPWRKDSVAVMPSHHKQRTFCRSAICLPLPLSCWFRQIIFWKVQEPRDSLPLRDAGKCILSIVRHFQKMLSLVNE